MRSQFSAHDSQENMRLSHGLEKGGKRGIYSTNKGKMRGNSAKCRKMRKICKSHHPPLYAFFIGLFPNMKSTRALHCHRYIFKSGARLSSSTLQRGTCTCRLAGRGTIDKGGDEEPLWIKILCCKKINNLLRRKLRVESKNAIE